MKDQSLFVRQLQNEATRHIAFKKLVSEYKQPLYWHIRHFVKVHADADDILQNTFIKAYRFIDSFKGNSKLYTWLYKIASNEAFTFIEKKKRILKLDDQEYSEYVISSLKSDVYFDGDAIELKLQQAILTLPPKQQEVFQLKYFENLKYSKISELTNTSVGALKASYHIATKKIEEYLIQD